MSLSQWATHWGCEKFIYRLSIISQAEKYRPPFQHKEDSFEEIIGPLQYFPSKHIKSFAIRLI